MPGGAAVKCSCGRSFATQQALAQHKASGSCRVGAAPKPKPQRQRKSGGGMRPAAAGAPINTAVTVRESGTDSATLAGVDRLAHVENVASYSHGQVVVDELLSASSFARLARVAGAYQKIRYRRLVFRVVPMLASTTSGGYVAAFVRDPSDAVPERTLDRLNWITSQQGSVTTKWWQSVEISVPVGDRMYYTSSSQEIREYSPGRIVVVADGRSSAAGACTVFADWRVSLEHASLEVGVSPSRPDHTTVLRNLWCKTGNTYVWSYDPSKSGDTGSPNPEFQFSDWAVGDLFMLPSAFTLEEFKTGSSGDAEVENFWVLHVESATGTRWRIHPDTTDSGRTAADDVLIIPRGAILRRVESSSSKVQGNLTMARESSLEPTNGAPLRSISGPASAFCATSPSHLKSMSPSGTMLPNPTLDLALVLDTLRDCLTEFRQHSLLLRGAFSTGRPPSLGGSFVEIPSDVEETDGLASTTDGPGS